MAIITISRGSFSKGKEVAEGVARRLNYASVSREILLETAQEFHIPEIKLVRAIHDAPSIFERFTFGKERYLAHIEAIILKHFQQDNVVYHGLAGHFFAKHILHVLKVRIIADLEERIATEMARQEISRKQALEQIKKDDAERRNWSVKLYGIDTWDAGLYDLVVNIHKLTVPDVVNIICNTVQLEQFQTTPESQKALDNLTLAAAVKAAVVDNYPKSAVTAYEGMVTIHIRASGVLEPTVVDEIKCLAGKVPGVKRVNVHLVPMILVED